MGSDIAFVYLKFAFNTFLCSPWFCSLYSSSSCEQLQSFPLLEINPVFCSWHLAFFCTSLSLPDITDGDAEETDINVTEKAAFQIRQFQVSTTVCCKCSKAVVILAENAASSLLLDHRIEYVIATVTLIHWQFRKVSDS